MRYCDDIRLNVIRQQEIFPRTRLFACDSVQVNRMRNALRAALRTANPRREIANRGANPRREIANRGASLRREIALRPIRNRESAGSRHLVPSCAIRAVIATRGSLRTLGSAAMQRLRRAAFPLALAATLALAAGILVDDSAAELENQVFTSRADRLRIVVPRGWRASDQPSYP